VLTFGQRRYLLQGSFINFNFYIVINCPAEHVFDRIGGHALEKTPVEEKGYREYQELFGKFLIPALALLMLEIILSNSFLRRLP
ncbi:hypothetical protein ACFL1I_05950, partial [Candidatus Omnitrophota bacterium]